MALTLILTASTVGRTPVAEADGFTLLVDGDRDVTLEVVPDPPTWTPQGITLLRDDEVVTTRPNPGLPMRWVFRGDDRFGTFRATADDPDAILDSPETTVLPAPAPVAPRLPGAAGVAGGSGGPGPSGWSGSASAAHGPDTSNAAPATTDAPDTTAPTTAAPAATPSGVVDVQVGEYDGRFAGAVAAIFTVLAVAVLWTISNAAIRAFEWGSATDSPAGTYTERTTLLVTALLIAVGSVLLLAGAALAALEVRARQRRTRAAAGPRGMPEALDKVPAILEKAGNLRATVAVLVAGVAVLILAVLVQVYGPGTGDAATPDPSPAASPTAAQE